MKKLFLVLISFLLVGYAFAADADARRLCRGDNAWFIYEAKATGDASNGNTLDVGVSVSRDITDAYAVEEPCLVYGFVATSGTAGDWAMIYDGNPTTGTALFDISIGLADSTIQLNFATGILVTYDVYVDIQSGSTTTGNTMQVTTLYAT